MTGRLATAAGLVGFFVVAGVALVSGLSPETATLRALVGASAAYAVTRVAMKAILGVIADQMAQSRLNGWTARTNDTNDV